jgi:Glycosyl transferase family 2
VGLVCGTEFREELTYTQVIDTRVMSDPLVSVVMITYNHARYIGAAIEGVLNQQAPFQYELVIGEDCSTDGTREIVRSYQERYPHLIRVIASDGNVGMVRNFLRTSRACSGAFLAFCEGDDYWHRPNKLKLQVEYLESHPSCGLVCSNYDVNDIQKCTVIRNFLTYKKWEIAANFKPSDWVSETVRVPILTVTVMLRRDLFENVINADPYLYDSGSFQMYDVPLWAEMAAVADVGYIPESLATYNVSANSVTRTKDIEKNLRFVISMCEMGLYLCKKFGLPEDKRLQQQEALWKASLELACHTRDRTLAEDLRRTMTRLSYMDWFRYYGTKSPVVYRGYMALRFLWGFLKRNGVVREERKWYE